MSRAVAIVEQASPLERDLMRACASLRVGKDGIHQPRWLRSLFFELEERKFATFTFQRSWRLTAEGKRLAAVFRAAGRAYARREVEA